MTIDQAMEIALTHHKAGRAMEAEQIYRQILSQQPDHPQALYLLGGIAAVVGKLDLAEELTRRAIAVDPRLAEAHNNLGTILRARGKDEEAIGAYTRAIEIRPDFLSAYINLADTHFTSGQLDRALAVYRHAANLGADNPGLFSNFGNALREKGLLDEAIAACRHALTIDPNFANAHINLGNALLTKQQVDEALACFRRAVAIAPDSYEGHFNLSVALEASGLYEQSVAACRETIRLKPDFIQAHWNLAVLLLSHGHFQEGWDELEWRLKMPMLNRGFPQPQWDGAPAPSKTILIHAEAGYGDAIQFVRLIPLLQGGGARFILECQPPLLSLLRDVKGIEQIIPRGDELPPFDMHIPLPSLARILHISLENMPSAVPYLAPPPQRVEAWAARLQEYRKFKVGLVWAGSNLSRSTTRSRSIDLFQPVAQVEGIQLFSLQKEPGDATKSFEAMKIIDFTPELHDFSETAALIRNLDLVISVDTSVAHLAGALGKPVWVLIPKPTDFRWLLDREDSPWYPTMKLFRQNTPGEWGEVVERIVERIESAKSEIGMTNNTGST